ncbi:hypothetical protein ACSBR2_025514 [Camellia fascicularis]
MIGECFSDLKIKQWVLPFHKCNVVMNCVISFVCMAECYLFVKSSGLLFIISLRAFLLFVCKCHYCITRGNMYI